MSLSIYTYLQTFPSNEWHVGVEPHIPSNLFHVLQEPDPRTDESGLQ